MVNMPCCSSFRLRAISSLPQRIGKALVEPLITYFLIGVFASFLGTLRLGPINLAVNKTTVDQHARAGLEFAIAASLIEILQAVLALWSCS